MAYSDNDDNLDSFSTNVVRPGIIVENYKIIRRLGDGAMSEVYLSEDVALNRLVVLKFLPVVSSLETSSRDRLINEARAASRLNHPNIIAIHSFGQFKSLDFIVMEYVDGQSLRQLLQSGIIPMGKIIEIALQIADALTAAHGAGIIHRDLKPENILLDEHSGAKICDFGLAYFKDSDSIADTSTTSGSLAYMSPEQVQGEKLDHRTDLFSLGVILYELITGSLPFRGDYEASIIFAIVNLAPESISKNRSGIPPGIAEIVTRLLAKNRNDRYQSAADFEADLKQATKLGSQKDKEGHPVKKVKALLLATLALILLSILAYLFIPHEPESRMLVVLPFENLGPAENEYLSQGVTDAITITLAKYSDLGVISSTTARQYRGAAKDLKEIASELKVDYVLDGSVRWDNSANRSRIKISCQLIRAKNDILIWAQVYEPDIGQLLDTQDEIAEKVAHDISGRIFKPRQLEPQLASNPQAYDYYLQGNYYYSRGWGEDDYRAAIQLYEEALTIDSNFVLPYIMLSRVHGSMFTDSYDHSENRLALSLQTANRALELQPNSPDCKLALGMYHYTAMRFGLALELFEETKSSRPNNPELYGAIAAVQRRQGDFRGALENFKHAGILEPRSPLRTFDIGMTCGLIRKYPEAESYINKAITLAPDWPLPYIYKAWIQIFWKGDIVAARKVLFDAASKADLSHAEYYRYYWWLSSIIDEDLNKTAIKIIPISDTASYYLYKARIYGFLNISAKQFAYYDSARNYLEPLAATLIGDPSVYSNLGIAYGGLGRHDEAIREGEKAVAMLSLAKDAYDGQFLVANLAQIYVMSGLYNDAIEQLDVLLSRPGFTSAAYLTVDPLWSDLWELPEFRKLIGKYR